MPGHIDSLTGENPLPDKVATELIESRFAAALLKLVSDRGYPLQPLLEYAGLPFDPGNTSVPGYRAQISASQYSRIYQQVVELLRDESFGVTSKRMVSPGAFRMMCYAIIHADNLGQALRRASDFYRIFYNDSEQIKLHVSGPVAQMGYLRIESKEEETVAEMEVYALAMWHRFCSWLTGRTVELQVVHFQGAESTGAQELERLYGCPVVFNQPETCLSFDAVALTWPLVHTEESLKVFLRTAPYQLMTMPARAADSSLVSQVRAMIGHDFSKGFPGFDHIARELNVSAPTLRRRLKKEGCTFQQLKDECRRDGAIAYLSRPDLSINAVAALMGFTDPSAFHRSFKKWTGMPPGEYRREALAHEGSSEP